jgi:hypothetical protein
MKITNPKIQGEVTSWRPRREDCVVLVQVQRPRSQWYKSSPNAGLKTQEEQMFHFESKDRKDPISQSQHNQVRGSLSYLEEN